MPIGPAETETAVERGPAADHRRLARRPVLNDPSSLSVRHLSSATGERPFTRAGPMVRIRSPPAVSRTKLLGCIGYLSLAKSKAGASFGSNRPAKTVDDSGEGQVEPGLSTSAGRSSSSRGQAASAAPEHWQVSALCRRWASLAEPRRYPLSRPGADVSRCGPHRRVGERFSVIASSLLGHEVGSSLHQLARVALTA